MGFKNGAYATVWEIEPKGTFSKVRLSTRRKDKNTGEYIQDFSGSCSMLGTANGKASSLRPRDRIKLVNVEVSNRYDKEKNILYTNYAVFDFEPVEQGASQNSGAASVPPTSNAGMAVAANDTESCPF